MFSTTYNGAHLGQAPSAQETHAASIASMVADAEARIWNAWRKFQATFHKYPHLQIDTNYIAQYQRAVLSHRAAARTWIQTRSRLTPDQIRADGGDPNAPLVYPPSMLLPPSHGGLGDVGPRTVPVSQILVKFGAVGNEKITRVLEGHIDRDPENAGNLGLIWAIALIIVGVLITAAVITYFVKEASVQRAIADAARADAERAAADAHNAEALAAAYEKTLDACGKTAMTHKESLECLQVAQASTQQIAQEAEKLKTQPTATAKKEGWGTLEIIGVITIVAAVGVGGYALYRYGRRRAEERAAYLRPYAPASYAPAPQYEVPAEGSARSLALRAVRRRYRSV